MMKHKQYLVWTGVILLAVGLVFATAGCGSLPAVPQQKVAEITENISTQTQINSSVYLEVFQLFSAGILAGYDIPDTPDPPASELSTSDSNSLLKTGRPDMSWTGPDSQGWYTRRYRYGYGGDYWFTEKYRYIASENAIEYINTITWDGAEGHFSYELSSRSAVNDEGLLDGYYDMKTDTSGDLGSSYSEFRFDFADFDKQTGAGVFDWWFGARSSGADDVAFHRYLNMIATVKEEGWLHVHTTCYEDLGGSWEYDCMYTPALVD